MKLIAGDYVNVKIECNKLLADGYFDFYFQYVSKNERFRELDRFLYESRKTLRFKNEYIGNVVLDISEWCNKPLNSYFEAFMYFIKDNMVKYNCILIADGRCSDELSQKLKEMFGSIEQIQIPISNSQRKIKIGFVIDEV